VLHKPANVLPNEPNLERLFLGGVVAKV
jgi:hypothetical protein